ncbi:hypothetical protein L6452_42306 [Arctium lappa]|uniref:Uncharacterized protein n=1 Tax=Arctium lappa TaxID=4217 RepID=A0ACB8XI45_ARCLA|nr:hypothetical protein L6452_42306 [Arctium lappa]
MGCAAAYHSFVAIWTSLSFAVVMMFRLLWHVISSNSYWGATRIFSSGMVNNAPYSTPSVVDQFHQASKGLDVQLLFVLGF